MTEDNSQDIPGMEINKKYSTEKPIMPQNTPEAKEKMDKTKKNLEKLKGYIVKKYPFTQSLSVLPPQAVKMFIDEEEIPKETEKHIQLYMIIPEDKFKEIKKILEDIVKKVDTMKLEEKIWIQIKTPVDVWEACLDSKFEITSAVAMSYPLHDTGFLAGLRVAEIHKSLVIRKFEKYVVSYVIAGSLVRGEAVETSDIDVFIIINDTDVKQMPRLELKERLRGIIFKYINEAAALAGVATNKLSPQVYLLTDFWESVKDAHPVMFTFIRDGIPIYDRGTFMPWKALLRMGKLKPSPEAIDTFMSMGDKTVSRAKRMLLDIFVHDIFWGVTTPAQAILMLNGNPPPNAKKEMVPMLQKEFVKTKMLEKKYVDFVSKVTTIWRDYEHEKIKEISGREIDKMLKEMEDYLKRLKELRKEIEKRTYKKTIEQVYEDTFKLLKIITKKKAQAAIVTSFEEDFVKKGKFIQQHLRALKTIVGARAESKKGKASSKKINEARKLSTALINDLMEYTQRCDLLPMEKGKMVLSYEVNGKRAVAELFNCDGQSFLVRGNEISKITDKVYPSNTAEVTHAVESQKGKKEVKINPKVFSILSSKLGEFEILI